MDLFVNVPFAFPLIILASLLTHKEKRFTEDLTTLQNDVQQDDSTFQFGMLVAMEQLECSRYKGFHDQVERIPVSFSQMVDRTSRI